MTRSEVNRIGEAFAGGLRQILGDKLYAAYLYGAIAAPDPWPLGDIDFHVILTAELTDAERSKLEGLHKSLGRRFPPLGGELDGYYILLGDARQSAPPKSQMWTRATDHAWALHRAHLHARRCIVLHGPDPREVYPAATWPELEAALCSEIEYVARHLADYPDYCILNLCRLIYSFITGDVVISKAQASRWALTALPGWAPLIEAAQRSYARQAADTDRAFMEAGVAGFLEFARTQIDGACQ